MKNVHTPPSPHFILFNSNDRVRKLIKKDICYIKQSNNTKKCSDWCGSHTQHFIPFISIFFFTADGHVVTWVTWHVTVWLYFCASWLAVITDPTSSNVKKTSTFKLHNWLSFTGFCKVTGWWFTAFMTIVVGHVFTVAYYLKLLLLYLPRLFSQILFRLLFSLN